MDRKKILVISLTLMCSFTATTQLRAKEDTFDQIIFDDLKLLNGYTEKYSDLPQDTIMAMIKDDTLAPYKTAAAVRIFKEKFSTEVFSREKKIILKQLLRRLNRTNSPFVQVEILHTLVRMYRYKYFTYSVTALIQKLNHYNETVYTLAAESLNDIVKTGNNKTREARIVFNTLRKVLFLSRKRLAKITDPGPRLSHKLDLLRWSIKVLGSQELNRLPKEVIHLL